MMLDESAKVAARAIKLELAVVPEDQRIQGTPRTGTAKLTQLGDVVIGVWEMTPGAMRDVENDEVLTVLSGSANIKFSDGSTLSLAPGDVARLYAGQQTEWTVSETLRKVYVSVIR